MRHNQASGAVNPLTGQPLYHEEIDGGDTMEILAYSITKTV